MIYCLLQKHCEEKSAQCDAHAIPSRFWTINRSFQNFTDSWQDMWWARMLGFGLIFGRLWAISWFNLTQSYSPVSLSCQYNKMWVITVQKAAPNVAFCASDISCIRKMALSFKIYDTPYRTEVTSLTHPSIQPPESASNAHHVLMNMINLCAGSLWTLFKHAPSAPTKHLTAVSDHQMFWRP